MGSQSPPSRSETAMHSITLRLFALHNEGGKISSNDRQ